MKGISISLKWKLDLWNEKFVQLSQEFLRGFNTCVWTLNTRVVFLEVHQPPRGHKITSDAKVGRQAHLEWHRAVQIVPCKLYSSNSLIVPVSDEKMSGFRDLQLELPPKKLSKSVEWQETEPLKEELNLRHIHPNPIDMICQHQEAKWMHPCPARNHINDVHTRVRRLGMNVFAKFSNHSVVYYGKRKSDRESLVT